MTRSKIMIGRCGRGSVDLDGISTWDHNGRIVTVRGVLHPNTRTGGLSTVNETEKAAVLAERQRLVGYAGNLDEPIVPVMWDCDPSVDGFYRVVDVNVNFQGASLQHGIFPIELTLEQIIGYSSPQFESFIVGAEADHPHVVDGIAWFAFPADVTEQFYGRYIRVPEDIIDCEKVVLRATPEGDLWFTSCYQFFNSTLRYYMAPESFYTGAGVIEVGNPLEVAVGTQIKRNPYNWRISNGLVRVTPSTTTLGSFLVSHYTGAGWSSPIEYTFFGDPRGETFDPIGLSALDPNEINGFSNITVLRNSPETVVFRISCTVTGDGTYNVLSWGRIFIDIHLRKGDRMARFVLTSDRYSFWGLERTDAAASTSIAGGIKASSDDADGNRYVMSTSSPFSTSNGQVHQTVAGGMQQKFDVGVGLDIEAAAAHDLNTAEDLVKQYLGWQTEKLVVAGR